MLLSLSLANYSVMLLSLSLANYSVMSLSLSLANYSVMSLSLSLANYSVMSLTPSLPQPSKFPAEIAQTSLQTAYILALHHIYFQCYAFFDLP